MKNFGRVLAISLRHRMTVAASLFCSLAVAVLWMGLYPKPFTDVMDVSVNELLRHVALSKLN